ncbi:hypothetical protein [Pseudomonas fluorescens]|uniref:Phage abortive infection protein n=1 Tax=Pseudomonas fluorescens TaxID=294 RepID=A0A5E7ABI1_PSEFL|nr:hypothetical protein [Pseudomonas fluorescens]VVN75635.1 hypothetical protein PS833_00714 [Pseudomonas fluorescens]
MYMLVIIALVAALVFVSAFAIYFFFLTKKKIASEEHGVEPFSPYLIGMSAVTFAMVILFLFYFFVDDEFSIRNNLGQVGDFVGGLTNPVLSFVGLIVLLRTTLIQTSEARKTTKFMSHQQFESTFFQLLDRLDTYCEVHLRIPSDEKDLTVAKKLGVSLYAKKNEFDDLTTRLQIEKVADHVSKIYARDIHIAFVSRAIRVLRFINNSTLPLKWQTSYAGLFIDTLYPHERIMLANFCFHNQKFPRKLIRKWKIVDSLKTHCFAADVVERYYKRLPAPSARK